MRTLGGSGGASPSAPRAGGSGIETATVAPTRGTHWSGTAAPSSQNCPWDRSASRMSATVASTPVVQAGAEIDQLRGPISSRTSASPSAVTSTIAASEGTYPAATDRTTHRPTGNPGRRKASSGGAVAPTKRSPATAGSSAAPSAKTVAAPRPGASVRTARPRISPRARSRRSVPTSVVRPGAVGIARRPTSCPASDHSTVWTAAIPSNSKANCPSSPAGPSATTASPSRSVTRAPTAGCGRPSASRRSTTPSMRIGSGSSATGSTSAGCPVRARTPSTTAGRKPSREKRRS